MIRAFAKAFISTVIIAFAAVAWAQQQTADPAFLQRAIEALQSQRNAALDGQAAALARVAMLEEENKKLKAQLDAKPPGEK